MIDRTKNAIVDSFNTLIKTTEFEYITSKKIADVAGISKATFYRYFKDKYEVMNYNYKALLDRLLQSPNCTDYRSLYYMLFSIGKRDWQFLYRAFKITGSNSLSDFIYEYSMETVRKITSINRNGDGLTPSEQLQIDVFCVGISIIYRKWIFEGYPLTANEAADALFDLMPDSLKYYWFKS
ncbi:TetR/AcrR family transcriptional regulator [Anaeromicropila herbilytica]|uniref:HTH tetR-type domain-containing protein n=1 Tax=Anaeromicropila herbilytica TaxID=2785025 RepID=A0A7R7ELT3_9FIRM|nr:TetR/AcrR family transcriptional regulator [Anaeromicropila herbilytica]BCN30976.1 hypothetical protein bsdtb5_22710 [Anaeromicropila herbilytica]